MSDARRMTFKRYGRCHHLHIATARDLASVIELDEAHWAAARILESLNQSDAGQITLEQVRQINARMRLTWNMARFFSRRPPWPK